MSGVIASVLGLLVIFAWVRFREGFLRIHPAFTSRPAAVLAKMASQAAGKHGTTMGRRQTKARTATLCDTTDSQDGLSWLSGFLSNCACPGF